MRNGASAFDAKRDPAEAGREVALDKWVLSERDNLIFERASLGK
jgi:hypothetical protein